MSEILDNLIKRYPILNNEKDIIEQAFIMMMDCYRHDGKIFVAGNGGSAADSDHICGELMKSFRLKRRIPDDLRQRLVAIDSKIGEELADNLECALPAITLVSQAAFTTAYINDVGSDSIFAQKLYGLGKEGDLFLGISTSGNSKNVIQAALLAKAIGIKVIALTGRGGGELLKYSDICVRIPEEETYKVQELHLPIYHCWCMMLEEAFFGANNNEKT